MLFNERFVPGLLDGSITLAFRRRKRAAAKTGGRQRIPSAVLHIDDVRVIDEATISEEDARRAGYASRTELTGELAAWPEGDLYRIELHLAGPDEREALREQADLTDDDLRELRRRFDRYDAAARHGAWPLDTLRTIEDLPAQPAARLAARLGRETLPFKTDVRKLKALGLTESLGTGYRLSPRGRAFLDAVTSAPDSIGAG